jgi:aerobic carbon-monoxide dehydrogenase medium subunit
MIPFDWQEPESVEAAIAMLAQGDDSVRAFSGGTALMLMMKAGVFVPSCLVSLAKIGAHHSDIALTADGALRIGAMASLSQLEQAPIVARDFPVMRRALRTLSNVRVRNVARVGGALAHGDPHMDLPPLLASLGAIASVHGPSGRRDIAIEDLYKGYYETVLRRGELIESVTVPSLGRARAAFIKVTSRSADDWPALNLGLCLETDGARIAGARIVVGAATEKVTRLRETEKLLQGQRPADSLLIEAGDRAACEVAFLSDAHGSAAYKKELLRVHLRRVMEECTHA